MRKILLPLVLCLPALVAAADSHSEADDVPIYEGKWTVNLPGHRTARFDLADWLGTWSETGTAVPAACRGRKMPVTVQHSTTEQLEFTVFGSSVSPACPDTSYVFKPLDGKTLEASLDAGGKATMKRARR